MPKWPPRESTSRMAVRSGTPTVWQNPSRSPAEAALAEARINSTDVEAARARWRRFAPLLVRLFPEELSGSNGYVDSPLIQLDRSQHGHSLFHLPGRVWIKTDDTLPIAGSVKARGGVYEVLVHAERIAFQEGLVGTDSDYGVLADVHSREVFSRYRIVVGSTGNLGLSVGLIAKALGFGAEVHVCAEAKGWKKRALEAVGAKLVEHRGDYACALAAARTSAGASPVARFVDDEKSMDLFLGYATAASQLAGQLATAGRSVSLDHPLTVFLPCGVGGAPGGICFGLKLLFGDAVVCVLVEPVQAPSMLVQLASGLDRSVSVYEWGLTNQTLADGLATPVASMLVAELIRELVDAVVTVTDDELLHWIRRLWTAGGRRLEPAGASGFPGSQRYFDTLHSATPSENQSPARDQNVVIWATGGGSMPDAELSRLLALAGRAVECA
ncbi:MAG TPA: D-serine ammonia-lyase [Candidatus Acidoferrum sp.]|nr:D-serine ammonia-lyase [Candidatus Acidoferrum sp.]